MSSRRLAGSPDMQVPRHVIFTHINKDTHSLLLLLLWANGASVRVHADDISAPAQPEPAEQDSPQAAPIQDLERLWLESFPNQVLTIAIPCLCMVTILHVYRRLRYLRALQRIDRCQLRCGEPSLDPFPRECFEGLKESTKVHPLTSELAASMRAKPRTWCFCRIYKVGKVAMQPGCEV